jgi:NADPH-dependent 2,4-dienoyl-CoA reductase/sulfur reductase-like enzyme
MDRTRHLHSDGIVIVGGGLAGQRCVEALRREGYERTIKLVCAEPHLPYDRPPLSKELLIDPGCDARIAYRSEHWYRERSIDVLLGVPASALDAAARRLTLADGSSVSYDQLLIATGGRPRSLPVLSGYDNVSVLRTLDDARELRDALGSGRCLGVIGAGFIGLEVAATARKLGVEVTLIEAAEFPLVGVLGARLGGWFAELHRAEGVDLRTGVKVDRVRGGRSAQALHLSDGRSVEVDHVVVGAGIEPNVGWLAASGVAQSCGVTVDTDGRTQLPHVYAAGDAAATFDAATGCHVPGSHWEAAARDGARVARMMLGKIPGPSPLTSFWTDQYGLRIQLVGRAHPDDAIELDGELAQRNFTATYHRAGRAVAALLVDRPRLLPAARQLIEKGTP